MELLETQDPEKKKLIESSDRHKKALEKELSEMKEKTDRMLTNALIIGGSLALTYFIISSFVKRKKKKKKSKIAQVQTNGSEPLETTEEVDEGPSAFEQIGNKILALATPVLLDLAREKLSEYLASRKKQDENT